jgi:hypothetical protein
LHQPILTCPLHIFVVATLQIFRRHFGDEVRRGNAVFPFEGRKTFAGHAQPQFEFSDLSFHGRLNQLPHVVDRFGRFDGNG